MACILFGLKDQGPLPKRTSVHLVYIFPKGVCTLSKHATEPIDCHLGVRFPTGFLRCPTAKVCDGKGKVW
jgi:hypothetical protein